MTSQSEFEAYYADPKNRTRARLLVTIVGIASLAGLAYYINRWVTAEERVGRVCAQFQPGSSVVEVTQVALANGMNAPSPNASISFVVESATFGRHGCKLQFKDGLLESATYDFQD